MAGRQAAKERAALRCSVLRCVLVNAGDGEGDGDATATTSSRGAILKIKFRQARESQQS